MKKPVLFWLHPHLSFWNGGTRYVLEIAKRLAWKYRLHIVVSTGRKEVIKSFKEENITIHQISDRSTNNILYWLFFPLFVVFECTRVKRLAKKYDPEVIISSLFPANVWALFLNKKHIQICWEPFAFFYDKDLINSLPKWKSFGSKILSILYSWLDKWSVRQAAKILVLNKSTGFRVKEFYKKEIDGYTYMGVDYNHFRPIKKLTVSEKKFIKRPLLFHSTDFTTLKGTSKLLDAMLIIKKKLPEILLMISSPHADYGNKNELFKFIRDNNLQNNIKFLGTIKYDLLPEYYSLVGGVVFTGTATASLSVLEALACKTPVVRSFYTQEEVVDKKTGFLIDPDNPAQLAKACITILTDSKLRKNMAEKTRESIKEKYNWTQSAKIILEAI
jgi:glycosyltransferase involved in cell wall biosynthesis